jgi:trimethylamine--corrinoid protein Co-methyltransferase
MAFDVTIDRIHRTALRILDEIGVALYHPQIIDTLSGFGIRIVGNRAFFNTAQVEQWLAKAPAEFTLHARNPEKSVIIGGDNTVCSAGYGCATVINRDGSRREGTLSDYLTFLKLVHQAPQLQLNGGILIQPRDTAPQTSHLAMLYSALQFSDECLVCQPGSESEVTRLMELMSIASGGLEPFMSTPKTIAFISTISPLKIDQMALETMLVSARYRQPMLISPAPAAGTTGPINLAGNLAMASAEALAAMVIAQILAPGIPLVVGMNCTGADMRTGNISIGTPALALQLRYNAALARRYGIPSRGGGALTDAQIVSAQSGYESMLSLMAGFENHVNLMVHSAGILDSFAGISYEKFLMDLEMIEMIKYARDEIRIDSEADLSFEALRDCAQSGQFLTAPETLQRCRSHSWIPRIGVRGAFGGQAYEAVLMKGIDKTMAAMLADYRLPPLPTERATAMRDYLRDCGLDEHTLAAIDEEAALHATAGSNAFRAA